MVLSLLIHLNERNLNLIYLILVMLMKGHDHMIRVDLLLTGHHDHMIRVDLLLTGHHDHMNQP
jgi:hypothetical protein